MPKKSDKTLPKMMPGSVHKQFVRCGKASCKCSRGELHGAYYYHFMRVGGKLIKRYLNQREAKQIQDACAAWREQQRARRERSREAWRLIRELKVRLREAVHEVYAIAGD